MSLGFRGPAISSSELVADGLAFVRFIRQSLILFLFVIIMHYQEINKIKANLENIIMIVTALLVKYSELNVLTAYLCIKAMMARTTQTTTRTPVTPTEK